MSSSKTPTISAHTYKFLQEKDSYSYLAQLRNTLSPEHYGLFVDEIIKRPVLRARIAIFRSKPSYSDLQNLRTLPPIEMHKELSWIKAFLIRSVANLQNFINWSELYSKALITGDYLGAHGYLAQIETKYGCSLWLIKTKMALLQNSEGLQSQKAYTDSIKESLGYHGTINYLTYWISLRNENSVTAARYENQFENNFRNWGQKTKDDLNVYIRYHLLGDELRIPEDAIDFPRIDFSRSLIDFYESFLAFARITVASGSGFKSSLLFILKALKEKVADNRLTLLHNLIAKEADTTLYNTDSFAAYDQFIQGNIEQSNLTSTIGLEKNADDPYLIFLSSFTKSLLNDCNSNSTNTVFNGVQSGGEDGGENLISQKSLNEQIQESLSELFNKGLGNQSALNKVEKLFQNFANTSWSGVFPFALYFIDRQRMDQQFAMSQLLKTSYVHPLLLRASENDFFFESCLAVCINNESSIATKFALASYSKIGISELNIFPEEMQSLEGNRLHDIGDYDAAISFGQKLTKSCHSFYQRTGYQLTANSLLRLRRIADLCSYIADKFVKDESVASIFPLKELSDVLNPKYKDWKLVNDNISLSIVIDAMIKNSISTEESYRAYACEDYLLLNGFKKPSQLSYDGSLEMLYYLRFLCIEPIMDISTEYDNPDDVEKERLSILRKLVEIDSDNEEVYNSEIKKIIRRNVIRQKMLEMEQNKIYVDLEKFRNWAHKELKENFLRYQVYLKNGLAGSSKEQILEAKSKNYEDDTVGLLSMVVPVNEPFSLLKSILVEVLEAYSLSSEFGLDRYLSTRLRHGAIENQLRKFMSQNHLVTKKESKKGIYKRNYHWLEKLGPEIYNSRDLDSIFRKFSEKFDALIEKIIYEWVVINRGNNDKALFMPPLRDAEVILLQSKLSVNTSFAQFLEIVISIMEERLTAALILVRDKLNDEAKPEVLKMLNQLQQQLSRDGIMSDLDNAVHTCRTQVQGVFERISDWFTPSISFENTEFPLEDAISVAEAIVQDTTPEFFVITTIQQTEEPLKINKLPIFFDIMINAFENVVKRACLEVPSIKIEIFHIVHGDEEQLQLKLTNELGNEVDIEKLKETLEKKKIKIEEGNYHSELTKENGSGLFKILQSLKDLNQSPTYIVNIDFGIIDKTYFLDLIFPPTKKSTENSQKSANKDENTDC